MQISSRFTRLTVEFLLVANILLLLVTFRVREFATDSIDWLILVKLLTYTVNFLLSVLFIRRWGHVLTAHGNLALVALLLLMMFSSVYSPRPLYTAGAAFSIISPVMLVCMAFSLLGEKRVMQVVLWALNLITALSLVAYVVKPELGRMYEWIGGAFTTGNRLTGITGTANAIGYATALALLLLYIMRRFFDARGLVFWGVCAMQTLALLLSQSRTAFAAMLATIVIVQFGRLTILRAAALFAGLAVAMVVLVMLDYDALFTLLSRTGDASEITTGTGRLQVWQVSMDYIVRRPLLGWGYGSTPFVMVNFTDELGHTVTHAHNAFLQIAFSLGLAGLLAVVGFYWTALTTSLRRKDRVRLCFLLFLLFTSLTESSTFVGAANAATLVLALIAALPATYRSGGFAQNVNSYPAYPQQHQPLG